MSGHSKWATIKHKKGALDAKQRQDFYAPDQGNQHRRKKWWRSRHEIPACAPRSSLPRPRTCRRIISSVPFSVVPANCRARPTRSSLEGYGPGGVAVLVDINTDNRNRSVSEIRHTFGKNGGNMAEAGAVSWMFHKKGDIVIAKSAAEEDDLMTIVLDAGAEDLRDDGENWEVATEPSVFEAVLEAVKKAGITPVSAGVEMIPQNYIKLEGAHANTMIRLLEALEEHDDVQNVHANFDIDQKLLEEVAG